MSQPQRGQSDSASSFDANVEKQIHNAIRELAAAASNLRMRAQLSSLLAERYEFERAAERLDRALLDSKHACRRLEQLRDRGA